MLKWYRNLYIGHNAEKKAKKLIKKINHGAGVLDAYLVPLAVNPENSLEIISANQLMQKILRESCPMIVGLGAGYEEAVEIVQKIAEEVYADTGRMEIRNWLLFQESQKITGGKEC